MATDRIQLQVLRSKDVLSGSTADLEVAKHFDGVTSPKLPTSEQLEFGEIALNIAKGNEVISIKNYDGEIIYLPFNVAQRLLDTNVSLDDLKEHTITTIESFSADTIGRFDSVYDDISRTNTQLSNTIQESHNTLSGRIESVDETITTTIESFSADTIGRFDSVYGYINWSNKQLSNTIQESNNTLSGRIESVDETITTTIESFSADTIGRFDSVYGYINWSNKQLSNTIQESNNTLSGKIDGVDETITTTIESFSADTQSKLNAMEFRILSGATTELISATSGNIVTIVEHEFSGTVGSLVERIDSVDSKVDNVKNNLHNEMKSVSGDILSQVDVVEEELLNDLNDLSGSIQTINEKVDSNHQKHVDDFYVLSIGAANNCVRITELSKSLDDISASTNSKIDNLKLTDLKDVEVSASTIASNEFNVAVYEDNKLKTKIIGGFDKMAVISDEDIEDGVTDGPVVGVVNATYATQAMLDSEGNVIATIFSMANVLESRISELEKLVGRLAECERRLDAAESTIQLLESKIG